MGSLKKANILSGIENIEVKTGNIRVNETFRCVRVIIIAVEMHKI